MSTTKLILTLLVVVVIFFLFCGVFAKSTLSQALGYVRDKVALKVLVKQDDQRRLVIGEVKLEPLYPSDYKLDLQSNYYTIKILAKDRRILFSGRIAHTTITFQEPPEEGEKAIPPIIQQLPELVLYLPYFPDAEKIVFLDEQGNLKLEVNLKDYKLELPPTATPPVVPDMIRDDKKVLLKPFLPVLTWLVGISGLASLLYTIRLLAVLFRDPGEADAKKTVLFSLITSLLFATAAILYTVF